MKQVGYVFMVGFTLFIAVRANIEVENWRTRRAVAAMASPTPAPTASATPSPIPITMTVGPGPKEQAIGDLTPVPDTTTYRHLAFHWGDGISTPTIGDMIPGEVWVREASGELFVNFKPRLSPTATPAPSPTPDPKAFTEAEKQIIGYVQRMDAAHNEAIGQLIFAVSPSGVIDDGASTNTLRADKRGGFELRKRGK